MRNIVHFSLPKHICLKLWYATSLYYTFLKILFLSSSKEYVVWNITVIGNKRQNGPKSMNNHRKRNWNVDENYKICIEVECYKSSEWLKGYFVFSLLDKLMSESTSPSHYFPLLRCKNRNFVVNIQKDRSYPVAPPPPNVVILTYITRRLIRYFWSLNKNKLTTHNQELFEEK